MLQKINGRKGLSPLVAAVVLISATIVGGMLVYQYFQNSMGKAQAMAEGLTISADTIPLSSGKTLVYVTVINNYDKPVKITGAQALDQNGTQVTLTPTNSSSLPTTLEAGGKTTIIFTADTIPKAIAVTYVVDGTQHVSEPVQVS
jgi:flagellin-like protein